MIKYFDDDTPSYVNSFVQMVKSNTDTIFKGSFAYSRKDSFADLIKYYHAEKLYVINKKDSVIMRFDPTKNQTFPIHGNIDGSVIKSYFLDIESLSQKFNDKENSISYKDSAHFLIITIRFPDEEDYHSCKKTYYIHKSSKIISKITYQAGYLDQVQNNHWILDNVVFDKVNTKDIENRINPYINKFPFKDYEPPSEDYFNLLDSGKTTPPLTGKLYPNYTDEKVLEINKITVLDFWYTSCMPCIKAIPELNKLKLKYKDKIEIIGVNNHESEENNKDKIAAFLNRTPMEYPIFFVKEIPTEYNIKAYPSIYIINKDSKVIHTQLGFREDTFTELDKIISEFITPE